MPGFGSRGARGTSTRVRAPLYVFKTFESFAAHMDEYVGLALQAGLLGWQVTDCTVTMTSLNYSLTNGPPSRRRPMPTAADRKLTPIDPMQALAQRGLNGLRAAGRVSSGSGERGRPRHCRSGPGRWTGRTPSLRGNLAVVETDCPEGVHMTSGARSPG